MAKPDDGTDLIKPPRRFPWRLWLYAIVMTAGAGAGGYFAWTFRQKATTATDDVGDCRANLTKLQSVLTGQQTAAADLTKKATECAANLDGVTKKAGQLETQLAQLSTNLDASKEELATLRAQRAEADKRFAAIEDFQKQFAKLSTAGQVKVVGRRGSLVLSLPSEVLFASGSADVSEQGTLAVLEIGITLKKLADRRFLVIGHTDDAPLKGSVFKDNWELSSARALNVTRTLVKAGMDPKNLIAAGAGEHDPVAKDRARNRRIEIALLPAINELPPLPKSLEASEAAPPVPAPTK